MITSTQKLLMARAGAGGGGIQYIGSVTKAVADENGWDSVAEALNVLSIAQTGDLVVIAFSFDANSDSSWSWHSMPFTAVRDGTGDSTPGSYVGYRFVQAGDSNPFVSGVSFGDWVGLTVVASVFRGVSSYVANNGAENDNGMPNPPALTAAGNLWVATGHLDDDPVTDWGAPTNYTLAASAAYTPGDDRSSTAIAYRIATLTSDDPGAFTGSGTDAWAAVTLAFS